MTVRELRDQLNRLVEEGMGESEVYMRYTNNSDDAKGYIESLADIVFNEQQSEDIKSNFKNNLLAYYISHMSHMDKKVTSISGEFSFNNEENRIVLSEGKK